MSPESERPDPASAEEIYSDFIARRARGEAIEWASFLAMYPELSDQLRALHGRSKSSTENDGEWVETYIVETDSTQISESHPTADDQILLVTHSDRYFPDGEIGHGGMGVVHKVWDKNLKRALAMKVIRQREAAHSGNSSAITRDETRFLDEAQIAARLEHPGVAPVHEIGRDADGQLYFTMRLVAGESLDAIFKKVWKSEDNWTQTRAIQVLIRVCETIAFAHSRGVIHRDLKLENVMVGQFGETYVMDWGLAKQLQSKSPEEPGEFVDEHSTDLHSNHMETRAGTVVGTPRFMPPEQAAGDIDGLDERADVYSIGAMLYALLARQMPYAEVEVNSSNDLIQAVLAGPPATVSECNPKVAAELIAICEKAMARRKEDRYSSAAELGDDLEAYLDNRVVRAYQTGALAEARKWFARNRWFAWASLAAVFAIIAGLGAVVTVQRIKNEQLQESYEDTKRESIAKTQALTEKDEALVKEQAALKLVNENLNRSQSMYLATRASSVLDGNPGLSLVLAVEAAETHQGELANNALISALDRNRERLTLTSAGGEAFRSARYSPDGKLILTGSGDGIARLWDASSGRLVRLLAGHVSGVNEATFNSDGSRIVTASNDGTAIVWNTATGKPICVLRGHSHIVWDAVFNPESTLVVTISYDNTARIWDVSTGRQLQMLVGHQRPVFRVVFSHDGRLIATGSADKTVRVWDAHTGEQNCPPIEHDGEISALSFSPDNKFLLSAGGNYPGNPSSDQVTRIWDAQTGQRVTFLEDAEDAVYSAVYSGDGQWIATTSRDGIARIYRVSTGKLIQKLDHHTPVDKLAWDDAGKYVATTTTDHVVRVWKISDGSPLSTFSGHEDVIHSIEFSAGGERLLTASEDGTAREWLVTPHGAAPVIVKNGKTQATLSEDGSRFATWVFRAPTAELREFPSADAVAEIKPGGDITSVAFSANTTKFAVATTAQLLPVYDASDGELLQRLKVPYNFFTFGFDAEGTHVIAVGIQGEPVLRYRIADGEQTHSIPTGEYTTRILSPTGNRLFAYSRTKPDGQLWNLQTGQLVAEITGGVGLNAQFDPQGRKLLIWSYQFPVAPRLFDADMGQLAGQLTDKPQRVLSARFIGDGSQVVTLTDDNHINFFDKQTLNRLNEVETANRTLTIQVNREFTRLIGQSDDKKLRLWDLNDRQQLAVLVEYAFGFGAFSPDGSRLVTWDDTNNLVVLRGALEGATLIQFACPKPADSAIFDPSGKWIVATCKDDSVRVWPLNPLELGHQSAPRELTPNERERLDVGDRQQWPRYRREWTADLTLKDLAALTPSLSGGGTWQQRTTAARLLRQLSQLVFDETTVSEQTTPNEDSDATVHELSDLALERGNAILAAAGGDDPRLLFAVAELDFQRKDYQSAILLGEEAVRSPAATSEQVARLQTFRDALPAIISFDSIDAALSQRSSLGENTDFILSPDNPQLAPYLDARRAQVSSQFDRAIPLFEELSGQSSDSALPAIHLAECLLAQSDAAAAEKVLATLLAGNPQADPAAWRLWSRISLADLGREPGQMLDSPVLKNQVTTSPDSPTDMPADVHRYHSDLAWLLRRWDRGEVVRINCGGGEYDGVGESHWQHDCFFVSGYRFGQTIESSAAFVGEIAGTDGVPVYQTERWWNASGDIQSRYRIPAPPGEYQITLHFAEIFHRSAQSRQFTITIEEKTERTDYSPGNRGFATADRVDVTARVDDGMLDIGFVPLQADAKISGIEIRRAE